MTVTPVQRRRSSLLRLDAWIARSPVAAIGMVVGVIALIKAGPGPREQIVTWSLASWPDPSSGYPHTSYGIRLIAYALRVESPAAYLAIGLVLAVGTVVLMAWSLQRELPGDPGRVAALLLLSGPLVWLLASMVGRADVMTVAGGFLLGTLGRRVAWAVSASLLLVLGNPELGVVAAASLAVASLAPSMRAWRRSAMVAIGITGVSALTLSAFAASAGAETRAGALLQWWRPSLTAFIASLPLQLFAGFGLALVLGLWIWARHPGREGAALAAGALVIPLAATAATLDQSRVLVGASAAAVTAIAVAHAPAMASWLAQRRIAAFAILAVAGLLAPPVEVAGTLVRVPWADLVPYLQSYVIDALPW